MTMDPREKQLLSTPSENTQWVLDALRDNARQDGGGWVGLARDMVRKDLPLSEVVAFVQRGVRESCEDATDTLREVRTAAADGKACIHNTGSQLLALALSGVYSCRVTWDEVGAYILESALDWVSADIATALTVQVGTADDLSSRTGYTMERTQERLSALLERGVITEGPSGTYRGA